CGVAGDQPDRVAGAPRRARPPAGARRGVEPGDGENGDSLPGRGGDAYVRSHERSAHPRGVNHPRAVNGETMGIAGFVKTQIRDDMFDIVEHAEEARRLAKCERIYHRGQEMAWDGREILPMLIAKHGGIVVDETKKEALKRVFAIIMWGELAAWKISAQLADTIVPLEAKMAATSQAFDEARHFYVMHDYLTELGYVPERLERAPQALLDLVLETDNPAYKLL